MSEYININSIDQLPILPERKLIEPIVQCGVLYLGTALPSPGLRGIDSIQEPFSHRYPVDGTNTAQGIDSVLSIYDNGIQITFARQPHVVIFFPISSLIYCASLRFSVVENDQTSSIDWRFITIDSTIINQSKHPPLFCAVVQRTQILPGDECHCFITKDDASALALVRVISEVYSKIKPNTKPFKSPIFYQLDRYGRKISETNGTIYLSPATSNADYPSNDNDGSISSINRNYLLDPSYKGFFYRTDANIIEQWQLWDDDDISGCRPRPPPSPFGQHQGIYHDDLTHEIHDYLRQMDDEERSSLCSCSSSSSLSTKHRRRHRHRRKSRHSTDQFHSSFTQSQTTSSFNPLLLPNNTGIGRVSQAPIIIEKVVPNPIITLPQTSQEPQQSISSPDPVQEANINYIPYSNAYQINEHGERITQEGNRIVYMDVVQPNINNTKNEITPISHHQPRRRRRRSRHIPVIDLQSIEAFINKQKSKQRDNDDYDSDDHHLSTTDVLEMVEGYFEDYNGKKIQLNSHDAETMLKHIEKSSKKTRHRRSKSSHNEVRRDGQSLLTSGPSINYVERPTIISPPDLPESNPDPVNEYVTGIYGSSQQTEYQNQSSSDNTDAQQDYMSPFRYMQSSVNPLLLREYRTAYYQVE